MTEEAKKLFKFENAENKVISDRPIDYSNHHSTKYFNISMVQEIVDGIITNDPDTYNLGVHDIKAPEFIWKNNVYGYSGYSHVYKHFKIYGDNSNFKIKYSTDDKNPIELPISNNTEFYMYLSDNPLAINLKCQDLWYIITATDQKTLTYTTSKNDLGFNLLPSPEKNNIVYKDDLGRYKYSKIKVGDNLKGKRIGLCNNENLVNTFLHNLSTNSFYRNIVSGKISGETEVPSIAFKTREYSTETDIDFYVKYADDTSYNSINNEIILLDSGYLPPEIKDYYVCTKDFIVESIVSGWDDILMVIDEIPLLSTKEDISNKVTTISSTPSDTNYPSEKAVYDYVQTKVGTEVIDNLNVTVSPETPKKDSDLWVKLSPSLKLGEKGYSQTLNGMTMTINDKYEIIFNGTTDKETQFDITSYPISKNEHIMSVKGGNANCLCGIYFFNDSGVYVSGIRSTDGSMVIQELTDSMTSYKATIRIPADISLNNYQPKMQIIYGSKDVEYSDYVEPSIYARTNERYILVSNKNIYTTGETLIGEFLGKPLYRKVIEYNQNTMIGKDNDVTNMLIPHNISNFKQIVNHSGVSSTGNILPILNGTNSTTQSVNISFVDDTGITFRIINVQLAARIWYFTLEYTKTTD